MQSATEFKYEDLARPSGLRGFSGFSTGYLAPEALVLSLQCS